MKKWSIISSLVVVAALAVAAFARSAPRRQPVHRTARRAKTGTPPYCTPYAAGGGGGGGGGDDGAGRRRRKRREPAPRARRDLSELRHADRRRLVIKVKPNSSTITLDGQRARQDQSQRQRDREHHGLGHPRQREDQGQADQREKEKLKEKGKLTLKVTVTYTPTGGSPDHQNREDHVKSPAKATKAARAVSRVLICGIADRPPTERPALCGPFFVRIAVDGRMDK